MIVYLLLAEAQATLLSAILTFSDRVIYQAYAAGAGLRGLSPLEDQALAGVIMWVPGSIAFTLALLWLVLPGARPSAPDARASGGRDDDGDGDERQHRDERRPALVDEAADGGAEAVEEQRRELKPHTAPPVAGSRHALHAPRMPRRGSASRRATRRPGW
jgi:hypothetical protein